MKKIFLIIFCLMLSCSAWAVYQRTDEKPYSIQANLRMHYCIPVVDTQVFDDGTKTVRRILGYKDHLCRYSVEEYNKYGRMTKKTFCKLTAPQRHQFTSAVKTDLAGAAGAKDFFDGIVNDGQTCKVETFKN